MARALTELQRQRLEPFHQRLWDSGSEPTPSWDSSDKQVLGGGEETCGGGEGRLKDRSGSDSHFFPLHLNYIAEPGQTTFGRLLTPQLGPGRAGAIAAAGDTQELRIRGCGRSGEAEPGPGLSASLACPGMCCVWVDPAPQPGKLVPLNLASERLIPFRPSRYSSLSLIVFCSTVVHVPRSLLGRGGQN